jgi:hypothetical protein
MHSSGGASRYPRCSGVPPARLRARVRRLASTIQEPPIPPSIDSWRSEDAEARLRRLGLPARGDRGQQPVATGAERVSAELSAERDRVGAAVAGDREAPEVTHECADASVAASCLGQTARARPHAAVERLDGEPHVRGRAQSERQTCATAELVMCVVSALRVEARRREREAAPPLCLPSVFR